MRQLDNDAFTDHYANIGKSFFSYTYYIFFLSGWVIYCYNSHSAIVQLFHGENKLIFNEMRMSSSVY